MLSTWELIFNGITKIGWNLLVYCNILLLIGFILSLSVCSLILQVVGDGVPSSSEEMVDYNDDMIDSEAFLEDDTYMPSA